jgi:hypothetical protein
MVDTKVREINRKINQRIKQRTGIKNSKDIEIYSAFCYHADLKTGTILCGDIIFDIYAILRREASEPMRTLERAYNESVGNREGIPVDKTYREFSSPLLMEAKRVYGSCLRRFIKSGLVGISAPDVYGFCVPQLQGYNFLNDSQFFKKTSTKTSEGRELRV